MTNRYDYRIGDGTLWANGTGTISTSIGDATVTGASTTFTTQLQVGDLLQRNAAIIGSVLSITDNTHLELTFNATVDLNAVTYQYNPMINVETLAQHVAPKSIYKPWQEDLMLGDGRTRGAGRPSTVWQYGFVSRALRDALRVYCTTASARVFVRTRTNESSDAYATFQAALHWPRDEQRDAGRRINFSLEFTDLVQL